MISEACPAQIRWNYCAVFVTGRRRCLVRQLQDTDRSTTERSSMTGPADHSRRALVI